MMLLLRMVRLRVLRATPFASNSFLFFTFAIRVQYLPSFFRMNVTIHYKSAYGFHFNVHSCGLYSKVERPIIFLMQPEHLKANFCISSERLATFTSFPLGFLFSPTCAQKLSPSFLSFCALFFFPFPFLFSLPLYSFLPITLAQ